MKRFASAPPTVAIGIPKIQYEKRPRTAMRSQLEAAKTALTQDGLQTPIIVSKEDKDLFTVRHGELELEAARSLRWRKIEAIVIDNECPVPKAIPDWVALFKRRLSMEMTDYDLAEAACAMEEKWRIRGSEFAVRMGMSKPYTYNLMRWFRNLPDPIRIAWREQNALINQAELERYSHMTREECLNAWRLRNKILSNKKNENRQRKSRSRRFSEKQVAFLQESIDSSDLAPDVKKLCFNILQFVLGTKKSIPGITDNKKLAPALVEKSA